MDNKEYRKKIEEERKTWKRRVSSPPWSGSSLRPLRPVFILPWTRRRISTSLKKVGFPGQYPFTAATFPTFPYRTGERGSGFRPAGGRAGPGGALLRLRAPEDTRDYYLHMKKLGQKSGRTSPSTFPPSAATIRIMAWPPGGGR